MAAKLTPKNIAISIQIFEKDFFAVFGGKRLVTLAVSVPGHHKMAHMKCEVVLMSIDTLIMFLCNVTMEILINMMAHILHFVYFGGQRLGNCF